MIVDQRERSLDELLAVAFELDLEADLARREDLGEQRHAFTGEVGGPPRPGIEGSHVTGGDLVQPAGTVGGSTELEAVDHHDVPVSSLVYVELDRVGACVLCHRERHQRVLRVVR